jgi:hypothetical protein
MSYKSQLFPQSGTSETPWRLPIKGRWGSSPAHLQDVKLLRSWLVYDSETSAGIVRRRVNWNLLLGLAGVVVISASFWAGIGLLISRVWK